MSDQKLKILAIADSLRRGSFNKTLLNAAKDVAQDDFDISIYEGLGELPFFNQDLEGENLPESVVALNKAIVDADAVLISTPEYSGATPGVLKNLLDWGARPGGSGAFTGKSTAVIGASPTQYGASRSVDMTSKIVEAIGGVLVERKVMLGSAHERLDSNGVFSDEMIKKSLSDVLDGIAQTVQKTVSVS